MDASVDSDLQPARYDPVVGIRVLADGVLAATSDADGLALLDLPRPPGALAYEHPGWRIVDEKGAIRTRHLDQVILPGCTRGALLAELTAERIAWDETPFTLDDMRKAREAFITSATSFVRPIVSVISCAPTAATPRVATSPSTMTCPTTSSASGSTSR